MNTLREVKFLRGWQGYRMGEVIKPSAALCQWLLANGYVEVVSAQKVIVPPVMAKKRGRPKRVQ